MKAVLLVFLAALAFAGCSSTGTATNSETELSAKEEVCGTNSSFMKSIPECLHMTAGERAKAEAYGHNQQVKSEAKETESVLKKREAERSANAIEESE